MADPEMAEPETSPHDAAMEEEIVSGHVISSRSTKIEERISSSRQPTPKSMGARLSGSSDVGSEERKSSSAKEEAARVDEEISLTASPLGNRVLSAKLSGAAPASSVATLCCSAAPAANILSKEKSSEMSELSVHPTDTSFDVAQQTTAAQHILGMSNGTTKRTLLQRLEHVRRGHGGATLFTALSSHAPPVLRKLSMEPSTDLSESSVANEAIELESCRERDSSAQSPAGAPSAGASPTRVRRDWSMRGVVTTGNWSHESYQVEDDESRVHFELRSQRAHDGKYQLHVVLSSLFFVMLIGAVLGCVASGIVFFETLLVRDARNKLVEMAFYGGDPCDASQLPNLRQRDSSESTVAAYLTFAGLNVFYIACASCVTYLAPLAAASGLPPLKAFLNGVNVPNLLSLQTLVAKVVGVTFVVSTGLPLGREGPMVHTGACVAALITRAKISLPSLGIRYVTPLDVRLPNQQRSFIGIGCAAGVAAAFNAPLGGILYAFEEVCSSWTQKMTWRSFLCVVVAALVYNSLINVMGGNISDSLLLQSGLVLGLRAPGEGGGVDTIEFFALAFIGVFGGVLGAMYVTGVVKVNGLRRRHLGKRPKLRVLEAMLVAFCAFTIYFFVPYGYHCRPCTSGMSVSGVPCIPPDPTSNATVEPGCPSDGSGSGSGSSGSASGSAAASASGSAGRRLEPSLFLGIGRRLGGGASSTSFNQWQCPPHHYNEMASLLHTGQEGLILHLLERRANTFDQDHTFDLNVLAPFLAIYIVLAIGVFGIFVPSGNFIPALTIGCGMGRLWGVAVNRMTDLNVDDGTYALMGAAAVLGGVTRMTLTLGVILAEVTKDPASILPMMFCLVIAKTVGDFLSPSFDHAMMHLQHLPFLDEEPPAEFDVLTARDVMARDVIVLREVERVGDLVAVLKRTRHNGFPIVDVGRHNRCTFFAGLILRRQLLVLLRERVWTLQEKGEPLSEEARRRFVDSAFASTGKVLGMRLTPQDRDAKIDLRPFMDPSPYVANELMPLRRVYRFFNEIGVRHLCVIDCREQVVGMITRKDVQPETIERRLMCEENLAEVKQLLDGPKPGVEKRGSTGHVLSSLKNLFGPNKGASAANVGVSADESSTGQGPRRASWVDERCEPRRHDVETAPAAIPVKINQGVFTKSKSGVNKPTSTMASSADADTTTSTVSPASPPGSCKRQESCMSGKL